MRWYLSVSAVQLAPPPTKWTISRRSPVVTTVVVQDDLGAIIPFLSTATRSGLMVRASRTLSSVALGEISTVRDWPLI